MQPVSLDGSLNVDGITALPDVPEYTDESFFATNEGETVVLNAISENRTEGTITVYDITGRKAMTIECGTLEQGTSRYTIAEGRIAHGVYIAVLETEDGSRLSTRFIMK